MHVILPSGVKVEYEDTHPNCEAEVRDRAVLLLIHGLGMQLVGWPDSFVDGFLKQGLRVIRTDNRDIGLSQHFDEFGRPPIVRAFLKKKLGLSHAAFYSLRDMATDHVGLLDALKINQCHVLGVSMGGMIAQWLAADFPSRVQTLTLVMTSSGARGLPSSTKKGREALKVFSTDFSREGAIERGVRVWQGLKGSACNIPVEEARARSAMAVDRSMHLQGVGRQYYAILCDTTRVQAVARISCPTTVIHGKEDPLIPCDHGVDLHERISQSKLELVDGMGHAWSPADLDLMKTEACALIFPSGTKKE